MGIQVALHAYGLIPALSTSSATDNKWKFVLGDTSAKKHLVFHVAGYNNEYPGQAYRTRAGRLRKGVVANYGGTFYFLRSIEGRGVGFIEKGQGRRE